MEEVQVLPSLLYQGIWVVFPGEVDGDVGVQKPQVGDIFHPLSNYNERGVDLSLGYQLTPCTENCPSV